MSNHQQVLYEVCILVVSSVVWRGTLLDAEQGYPWLPNVKFNWILG